MVIIFLVYFSIQLYKKAKGLDKGFRQRIIVILTILLVSMVAYELYVEYSVGWAYGVPNDDDCGWIFRSSQAMHDGMDWREVYKLAYTAKWDAENRGFSLNNLGQYMYLAFVYFNLYFPTIFDLHINLYLIYGVQCLMVLITALNIMLGIEKSIPNFVDKWMPKRSWIIALVCFYPALQFSSYKTLRETFFIFFVSAAFEAVFNSKDKVKMLLYSFVSIMIRPFSVIFLLPIIISFIWDKRAAQIVNLGMLAVMLIGTNLVTIVARSVGWTYRIGNVKIADAVHLFLFPDVFHQFKLFLALPDNPSWVTILYFFQSLWSIPCLILVVIGATWMPIKNKDLNFWIILFINTLIAYTIPYTAANMTPRYKLLFFIPQLYLIIVGICRLKKSLALPNNPRIVK